MEISKKDYFFYEWLILSKGMTKEQFVKLLPNDLKELEYEYKTFLKSLKR